MLATASLMTSLVIKQLLTFKSRTLQLALVSFEVIQPVILHTVISFHSPLGSTLVPMSRNSPSTEMDHNEQTENASDCYARILLTKRIGYPLWVPEPSEYPQEYHREGVSVGDIGVITFDGRFDFIFNICLPSYHPVNCQAPPALEPLGEFTRARDVTTIPNMHSPGCVIASQSIQREFFESDMQFHSNG